jgi:hypothetical protein
MSDSPESSKGSSLLNQRETLEAEARAIIAPILRNHGWYITEVEGRRLEAVLDSLAAVTDSENPVVTTTMVLLDKLIGRIQSAQIDNLIEADQVVSQLRAIAALAAAPDARLAEALRELELARGRLALLGAHDFTGRLDRACEECGKPDRHPLHSAAYVARAAAREGTT